MTVRLYLALLHYPVLNKHGEEIASAITNLDLHDIARATTTYGLCGYYVVTPLEDQRELATTLIGHWQTGYGATYNPQRGQAFEQVRLVAHLTDVMAEITHRENDRRPITIATTARQHETAVSFASVRDALAEGWPHLLLLGTAWGLAPRLLADADHVLEPVWGPTPYNHLSVRSAAAIMLDRLLGTCIDSNGKRSN